MWSDHFKVEHDRKALTAARRFGYNGPSMALSLLVPLPCQSCDTLHIDEGPWDRHGR